MTAAPTWQILAGDCREVLRQLPAESVHTVITSPPYFGLRDYGTGSWEGGDDACEHRRAGGRGTYGLADGASAWRGESLNGASNRAHVQGAPHRGGGGTSCRCGAVCVDRQVGLEPSPDEFAQALVAVFREVWRVLRSDGTVWLNLGDSYCGAPQGNAGYGTSGLTNPERHAHLVAAAGQHRPNRRMRDWEGIKPKDLIGAPWLVAFALRADGWYLRSEIVWHKPNPMPESVTDRPTKAHEQMFLLSKGPRYFYDAHAIREADSGQDHEHRNVLDGQPSLEPSNGLRSTHGGLRTVEGRNGSGRNKRSVWTVATQPYPGAHFATFPPRLIEPCVLAGAPERACGDCGAPWVRVVERTAMVVRPTPKREAWQADDDHARTQTGGTMLEPPASRTVDFTASCDCAADVVPGVVLDPFAGAGTTILQALRANRSAIGVELSPEYAALARARVIDDAPLLNSSAQIA